MDPASAFADARVYVTGATGFIGGRVVEKLRAGGARVTALVRPATDASRLERLGVEIHRGSVTEPPSIRPDGADLVVHMAAWVGFGIPKRKRDVFWKTNVEGTRAVLEAARKAGVAKAVHVSSIAVLGETGGRVVDESFERGASFKSFYERTKLEAHRIALEYDDLAIALPMPGVVLGRGSDWDVLFRAYARGTLPALPKRDGATGFVHVDDTADGILLAAAKGRGPFLLVDRNLTFEELFADLEVATGIRAPRARVGVGVLSAAATMLEGAYALLGKHPPLGRELVNGLKAEMRYDASRARKELGWQPDLVRHLASDVRALASEVRDSTAPRRA